MAVYPRSGLLPNSNLFPHLPDRIGGIALKTVASLPVSVLTMVVPVNVLAAVLPVRVTAMSVPARQTMGVTMTRSTTGVPGAHVSTATPTPVDLEWS